MELEVFLNSYPEEVRSRLRAAQTELISRYPALCEEPDLPSRILVYRLGAGNQGVVFTLIPSHAGVKLGIYKGRELDDPAGLLSGSGKVHATIPLNESTFDDHAFINLLDTAMRNALLRVKRRK
jgi:hypothetical protein